LAFGWKGMGSEKKKELKICIVAAAVVVLDVV